MDFNFTGPDDVIQPMRSMFFCSFMMSYPKVLFNHCVFNNPMGALNVTMEDKHKSNDWNKALRIEEPNEPIDPNEWVIIAGQTFDFCFFPVKIYGFNCEIVYQAPIISKYMFTQEEWRRLEDIYGEQYMKEGTYALNR